MSLIIYYYITNELIRPFGKWFAEYYLLIEISGSNANDS